MRKFAFALLAIFFVTNVNAQEQEEHIETFQPTKRVSWGVKAGLNLANERNAPESKFRTGFHAGFFMELKLNERFSLQPELMYSQQGSTQYRLAGARTSGDNILQYDYINLPLLLKVYVYQDKLSVEVGPQFGYMVRHYQKRMPRKQTAHPEKLDSDWMNKFDVAASIGATYKLYAMFEVYARYNYGFMNTYDSKSGIMIDEQMSHFVDNKNSVIQIGLAARF